MTLICAAGWMHLFPDEAQALITGLKHQLRRRMLQRATLDGSKELACSLHLQAAQLGIDAKLVDQFLAEHHGDILGSLENIYADRILEDPDDSGGLG